MIPTPDKLILLYPSKDLPAANSPLTDRSVIAGSTSLSIMTNSISQDTGYWNGGLGFFCGATTQQALKGKTFHIWKWVKEENRLYITTPLPVVPTTTDKFRIFAGGKYASSQEVFGLSVAGKQPEVDNTVIGSNITGIIILKAAGMLGEGTLTIQFDATRKALSMKMNSGLYGPEVVLSENGISTVYNEDFSGFILVDTIYSALKTSGTHLDTFALAIPKNVLIPNYEGYETNTGRLVERYHLLVVKNASADPIDAMTALSFWTVKPNFLTAKATSSLSNNLCGQPGSLTMDNGVTNWPTRGFWIRNLSTNYAASYYVRYRNGNTLYLAPRSDGCFAFTAGKQQLVPGAVVQFNSGAPTDSNGTLTITRLDIQSGSLATGDAKGIAYFTKATGTSTTCGISSYAVGCYLTNTSTTVCTSSANTALFRGWRPRLDLRAVNYDTLTSSSGSGRLASINNYAVSSGDTFEVWPDFDLGVVASSGIHADPVDEYSVPDGIMFQPYVDMAQPLIHDILLGGNVLSLWVRQTIVDGTQARQNIVGNIRAMWY